MKIGLDFDSFGCPTPIMWADFGASRQGQGLFWGPTLRQSVTQRAIRNASSSTPLTKMVSFTIKSYEGIKARMRALFSLRSPSAVLGAVWAFAVNSVNAVGRRWGMPHISKKAQERIPARTDKYTSPSIHVELRVRRINATGSHAHPDSVNTSSGHIMLFHGNSAVMKLG